MSIKEDVIILRDAEGNEVEFEYLDKIEYGYKEFIVLLPIEDEAEIEEGLVVILEMVLLEDGNEEFRPVEDEQTLGKVFEMFKMRFSESFDFTDEEDDEKYLN